MYLFLRTWMLTLLIAFLATGCAGLALPKHSSDQTLLVIPKQTLNNSLENWVRRYFIEVEQLDGPNAGAVHDIWIDTNKQNIQTYTQLGEGRYRILNMKWRLASRWRSSRAMGEGLKLDIEFSLHDGEVKILPWQLYSIQEDNGDGIMSYYGTKPLKPSMRKEIEKELETLPEGKKWLGLSPTIAMR